MVLCICWLCSILFYLCVTLHRGAVLCWLCCSVVLCNAFVSCVVEFIALCGCVAFIALGCCAVLVELQCGVVPCMCWLCFVS